jgi:hypothetical protein
MFAEPIAIKVTRDGSSSLNFVPGVPIPLDFKVQEELKDKPKGTQPVGYLRFRERNSHDTVLRVPIEISG